jgi:hypothetical protein
MCEKGLYGLAMAKVASTTFNVMQTEFCTRAKNLNKSSYYYTTFWNN